MKHKKKKSNSKSKEHSSVSGSSVKKHKKKKSKKSDHKSKHSSKRKKNLNVGNVSDLMSSLIQNEPSTNISTPKNMNLSGNNNSCVLPSSSSICSQKGDSNAVVSTQASVGIIQQQQSKLNEIRSGLESHLDQTTSNALMAQVASLLSMMAQPSRKKKSKKSKKRKEHKSKSKDTPKKSSKKHKDSKKKTKHSKSENKIKVNIKENTLEATDKSVLQTVKGNKKAGNTPAKPRITQQTSVAKKVSNTMQIKQLINKPPARSKSLNANSKPSIMKDLKSTNSSPDSDQLQNKAGASMEEKINKSHQVNLEQLSCSFDDESESESIRPKKFKQIMKGIDQTTLQNLVLTSTSPPVVDVRHTPVNHSNDGVAGLVTTVKLIRANVNINESEQQNISEVKANVKKVSEVGIIDDQGSKLKTISTLESKQKKSNIKHKTKEEKKQALELKDPTEQSITCIEHSSAKNNLEKNLDPTNYDTELAQKEEVNKKRKHKKEKRKKYITEEFSNNTGLFQNSCETSDFTSCETNKSVDSTGAEFKKKKHKKMRMSENKDNFVDMSENHEKSKPMEKCIIKEVPEINKKRKAEDINEIDDEQTVITQAVKKKKRKKNKKDFSEQLASEDTCGEVILEVKTKEQENESTAFPGVIEHEEECSLFTKNNTNISSEGSLVRSEGNKDFEDKSFPETKKSSKRKKKKCAINDNIDEECNVTEEHTQIITAEESLVTSEGNNDFEDKLFPETKKSSKRKKKKPAINDNLGEECNVTEEHTHIITAEESLVTSEGNNDFEDKLFLETKKSSKRKKKKRAINDNIDEECNVTEEHTQIITAEESLFTSKKSTKRKKKKHTINDGIEVEYNVTEKHAPTFTSEDSLVTSEGNSETNQPAINVNLEERCKSNEKIDSTTCSTDILEGGNQIKSKKKKHKKTSNNQGLDTETICDQYEIPENQESESSKSVKKKKNKKHKKSEKRDNGEDVTTNDTNTSDTFENKLITDHTEIEIQEKEIILSKRKKKKHKKSIENTANNINDNKEKLLKDSTEYVKTNEEDYGEVLCENTEEISVLDVGSERDLVIEETSSSTDNHIEPSIKSQNTDYITENSLNNLCIEEDAGEKDEFEDETRAKKRKKKKRKRSADVSPAASGNENKIQSHYTEESELEDQNFAISGGEVNKKKKQKLSITNQNEKSEVKPGIDFIQVENENDGIRIPKKKKKKKKKHKQLINDSVEVRLVKMDLECNESFVIDEKEEVSENVEIKEVTDEDKGYNLKPNNEDILQKCTSNEEEHIKDISSINKISDKEMPIDNKKLENYHKICENTEDISKDMESRFDTEQNFVTDDALPSSDNVITSQQYLTATGVKFDSNESCNDYAIVTTDCGIDKVTVNDKQTGLEDEKANDERFIIELKNSSQMPPKFLTDGDDKEIYRNWTFTSHGFFKNGETWKNLTVPMPQLWEYESHINDRNHVFKSLIDSYFDYYWTKSVQLLNKKHIASMDSEIVHDDDDTVDDEDDDDETDVSDLS